MFATGNILGQQAYQVNLKEFQAAYVTNHEVVKGKDKQYFRFFGIDSSYRLNGKFEKINDSTGFTMRTSGIGLQQYFIYGKVSFTIRDTLLQLFIYQSKYLLQTELYKDYLFMPFTDLTNAGESYGGGRYLDFTFASIRNNILMIDFNKAYNPNCAYATGFNCPLPPKENSLPVAVMAGEKIFGKPIH